MKRLIGLLVLVIVLALVTICLRPAFTPAIRDARGNTVPGSMASLEKIRLGSIDQWILIRGRSQRLPILLFLHGGPGMPMMYLAHAFQRPLEEQFLVVQWDQRGAGKSYRRDIPRDTINIEQLLADAVELTRFLQNRFHQEKIILVGHSFGTYLGTLLALRHPDLYSCYVGVGQEADASAAGPMIDDFIRRTAEQRGRQDAIEDLAKRGPAAREDWLFEFGAEIYRERSWVPLLRIGLLAPEYSFRDAMNVRRGVQFTSHAMKWNAISGPLREAATEFRIPITFFLGRHDFTTPWPLAEEYFHALQAPYKRIVWFQNSAHFPFLEEPRKFVKELIAVPKDVRGSPIGSEFTRGDRAEDPKGEPTRSGLGSSDLQRRRS